ncbi:hypothetical protein [Streptomyces sp. NPDC048309]|uniref:hypothetical protein n=1 Tax=Streptomyces sp. NPDC048309 TaxID=3154618 RepID=UPI003401531F
MPDNTPPPMPDFPPSPRPVVKKNHTNAIIVGSAAALIAAVVATGVVVVQSRDDTSRPGTAAESSTPGTDAVADAADPEPTYTDIDANSFTIELRTTKRQCFGSAGCNVTVEPDLTYLGDTEGIDPDAMYEITYEIHGDEAGPVIETAELSDRTTLNFTPSLISTASAGTKVSVEITDVAARG